MRAWILYLSACAGSPAEFSTDTSFPGFPEVLAVSADCEPDGDFVVRARTVGWSEAGVIQIWEGSDVSGTPIVERDFRSIGFRRDEWCDFLEGPAQGEDANLPECRGDFESGYTVLLRVTYESGCAGEQAIGPGAASALGGEVIDPTGLDDTCPAPMSADWMEADPPPSLDSDVVSFVPPCDEAL